MFDYFSMVNLYCCRVSKTVVHYYVGRVVHGLIPVLYCITNNTENTSNKQLPNFMIDRKTENRFSNVIELYS